MNNLEYCQGIHDAAKEVVKHYHDDQMVRQQVYTDRIYRAIDNLERALEGKENA